MLLVVCPYPLDPDSSDLFRGMADAATKDVIDKVVKTLGTPEADKKLAEVRRATTTYDSNKRSSVEILLLNLGLLLIYILTQNNFGFPMIYYGRLIVLNEYDPNDSTNGSNIQCIMYTPPLPALR